MALGSVGCGSSSTGAGIPLVEPPVTRVTPAGLTTTAFSLKMAVQGTLGLSEIKDRFFNPAGGPTNIKELLKAIDTRINEINTRSQETDRTCLSATPVAQTLSIFGQSVTAYFQCYDLWSDSTGGMLFGKKDDTWYLYTNGGQSRGLAIVTPVSGSATEYTVESWISVGQLNGTGSGTCGTSVGHWYGCSYAVIHLKANSATKAYEMTTSGVGVGYCGAHLRSDGANIYVLGSPDTGSSASWSCGASDNACTTAASLTATGTCTGLDTFALTTLGVSASLVGQTSGIVLDGTSTDSAHFGPEVSATSAITGVAKF